jgi:acyl transferase domain-containing protein
MRVNVVNRMVGAVGIGAVALLGWGVVINAQPERGQQQQQDAKDKQEKDRQAQQSKDKQAKDKQAQQQQAQRGQQQQAQRDQQQQAQRGQQQQAQRNQQQMQHPPQPRLAQPEQQRLIGQQQQRLVQYGTVLDQQTRVAQQQTVQLQRDRRTAQYNVQVQYMAGLNQQQVVLRSHRNYNYGADPYFYTRSTYRYSRGGVYYQTNQYGVDLLRQAVNHGYDQGLRAGMADRQDRWASNYETSYPYLDANYGYTGFYVDRADYNYYFREGFRRGYQDGYNSRYQYGTYVSGRGTILGAILATIINFQSIR